MYYGIDVGRGFVKCISDEEDEVLKFPSYVSPAEERNFTDARNLINDLEVTISDENETYQNKYFIGELSKEYGGSREYDSNKVEHPNTLPLLLTSIALVTESDMVTPKVVTGLPITALDQGDELKRNAQGIHKVTLPNGDKKTIELTKDNFKIFPEGLGAAWNEILGPNGQKINKELKKSTFGVIDIGWKTANILVVDNLQFKPNQSTTLNEGLSKAFNKYYNDLREDYDISTSKAADYFEKDIKQKKRITAIEKLVKRIETAAKRYWDGHELFDTVFYAGGGAYATWDKFQFGGNKVANPQLANCRGYYKMAKNQLDT